MEPQESETELNCLFTREQANFALTLQNRLYAKKCMPNVSPPQKKHQWGRVLVYHQDHHLCCCLSTGMLRNLTDESVGAMFGTREKLWCTTEQTINFLRLPPRQKVSELYLIEEAMKCPKICFSDEPQELMITGIGYFCQQAITFHDQAPLQIIIICKGKAQGLDNKHRLDMM